MMVTQSKGRSSASREHGAARRVARVLLGVALVIVSMAVGVPDQAGAGAPPSLSFNNLFASSQVAVNGDYVPLAGINGCGGVEQPFILWYASGVARDYLWTSPTNLSSSDRTSSPVTINGHYKPAIGDFDADGCDDILWYAPGGDPDYLWFGESDGTFRSAFTSIVGDYEPLVGDYDSNGSSDIFFYAPGSGQEYLWSGNGDRTFTKDTAPAVNGTYSAASTGQSIYFHRPESSDYLWSGIQAGSAKPRVSLEVLTNGAFQPIGLEKSFLLYAPGRAADSLVIGLNPDHVPVTLPGIVNGRYTVGLHSPQAAGTVVWHRPGPGPDFLWQLVAEPDPPFDPATVPYNFLYPLAATGGSVPVRDGSFEGPHPTRRGEVVDVKVNDVKIGDWDDDGDLDALVLLREHTDGTTGRFDTVRLLRDLERTPHQSGLAWIGDRIVVEDWGPLISRLGDEVSTSVSLLWRATTGQGGLFDGFTRINDYGQMSEVEPQPFDPTAHLFLDGAELPVPTRTGQSIRDWAIERGFTIKEVESPDFEQFQVEADGQLLLTATLWHDDILMVACSTNPRMSDSHGLHPTMTLAEAEALVGPIKAGGGSEFEGKNEDWMQYRWVSDRLEEICHGGERF